ncbi:MAG: CPBP family intramembrane metalloprotease [Anaerolineales bacterium]|nr:CPBP family intramembrane metalloprotease [Anaerolineales bacterium]
MKKLTHHRIIYSIIVFGLLLFLQIILGKAGHFFTNMVPYQQIDPYDIFARISIHHAIELIIALVIILALSKLLKLDFYFQFGDVRKGVKYSVLFIAVSIVISIALHIIMFIKNQLSNYAFPLDVRNIIGTLGFQLFFSGPAEEVVFRTLPITLLVYAFGKSILIKSNVTLEVVLASILFSFAHTNWSLKPFVFEVDYFQLFYSFVLGTIQGIVYQRSKSILYPMLMHSSSNVFMVGIGYMFKVFLV